MCASTKYCPIVRYALILITDLVRCVLVLSTDL